MLNSVKIYITHIRTTLNVFYTGHLPGNTVYDITVSTQKKFYYFLYLYHTQHDIHSLIIFKPFDPA